MDDEEYKKQLADNGVELDEADKADEKEPEPAKKADTEKSDDKKDDEVDADKEPLKDQKKESEPSRKRTIYDEYKDKKSEARTEKERADKAEQERDELARKLEAVGKADTPEERKDAQDEIDSFLSSHKEWDKTAIQDLLKLAQKGAPKPEIDEALKKDLEDFKAWKQTNSKTIEQQMFNEEFEKTVPSLKQLFPTVTDDELKAVKSELDKLSHTKDWHDKDLEYVAFKHKDTLAALISPKKRGMESKSRKDVDTSSDEFDPTADYASMTPKQKETWEANYKALTKSDGLSTAANGKKLII